MSDQRLADLVRHAEGDTPTTAEMNRMRRTVMGALDGPTTDHFEIGSLRLDEARRGGATTRRITGALLAAAATVLIVVGIALTRGSDGDADNVETVTPPPAPTAVTEPAPEPTAPEPTVPPTSPPTAEVPEPERSTPPGTVRLEDITNVPIRLDPATYWFDSLGTEIEVDVDEGWTAHRHTDGRVVLGDAFTQGPGDNDVIFIRATELADPTRPTRVVDEWFSWPADDIDAWIDAAAPGVNISGVRNIEVGGYPATTFDVVIDPDEIDCVSKGCIRFATNGSTYAFLGIGDGYRVWFVEQGEFEPLVIVSAAERGLDEFFLEVDELIATIDLGVPQPMPTAD